MSSPIGSATSTRCILSRCSYKRTQEGVLLGEVGLLELADRVHALVQLFGLSLVSLVSLVLSVLC